MNAGSEKRCCSAARWKLQPVVSTFSTWLASFLHRQMSICIAVSTDGAPAMVGLINKQGVSP